jgi:hypothetical protein
MSNTAFKLDIPALAGRPEMLHELQSDVDYLVATNRLAAAEQRKKKIESFYAVKK